jgi:hypothetical protein
VLIKGIGILLKSPQQVVLGPRRDLNFNIGPRTIVDLINLLGLPVMIHRAGSSQQWLESIMYTNFCILFLLLL